jgi:hypothetical protein
MPDRTEPEEGSRTGVAVEEPTISLCAAVSLNKEKTYHTASRLGKRSEV